MTNFLPFPPFVLPPPWNPGVHVSTASTNQDNEHNVEDGQFLPIRMEFWAIQGICFLFVQTQLMRYAYICLTRIAKKIICGHTRLASKYITH